MIRSILSKLSIQKILRADHLVCSCFDNYVDYTAFAGGHLVTAGRSDSSDLSIPEVQKDPDYRIEIIDSTPHHTLVPNDLFDINQAHQYFRQLTHSTLTDPFVINELPFYSSTLIFRPSDKVVTYGTANGLKHVLTVMIELTQSRLFRDVTTFGLGLKQGNLLNLVLIRNRKLILANHFNSSSTTDMLYYAQFAYQSMGLDPIKSPFYLSGEWTHDMDELKKLLSEYFADLRIASPATSVVIADHLEPRYANTIGVLQKSYLT